MSINDIADLGLNGDFDSMISELGNHTPNEMSEFYNIIEQKGKDLYKDILDKLSDDQYKLFKWLGSSEREKDYLMKIGENRELSDDELLELRTCDF